MNAKHAAYWQNAESDNENSVNGFAGEFAITDHDLIPMGLRNFLLESFPRKDKLSQIPLKDVNATLNEAWHGPGSMANIVFQTELKRRARTESDNADVHLTAESTVDDLVAQANGKPKVGYNNADQ
jgi:hypothetical protein